MTPAQTIPGLYFIAERRLQSVSPLRTDIAAFIGPTRRGTESKVVRVEGWRGYVREFGGLPDRATLPYSIRGYFENGGEVAYVVRICGKDPETAKDDWIVGEIDGTACWTSDSPTGFSRTAYEITASSPGSWANGLSVSITYRNRGPASEPDADIRVLVQGENVEHFAGVDPAAIDQEINGRSVLIRMIPAGASVLSCPATAGPARKTWEKRLNGGTDGRGGDYYSKYKDALIQVGDEIEVALVAIPGLWDHEVSNDERNDLLHFAIDQAEQLRDRLVLVDLPRPKNNDAFRTYIKDAVASVRALRSSLDTASRAAALYHPSVWVLDPLNEIIAPLRAVPPSGHVAGVISRMDRERGAHHTPANGTLFDAVDPTETFKPPEQAQFNDEGVNLVRCFPGRGLQVWGGRTLETDKAGMYIAHRRLIHRLVRTIRRVADPLVFETNGPELWLTIVRGITTVLLEAYRAGALKGARPEEAFRVTCDATTTPVEEQELGRAFCAIEIAPAVPMEFITLRVVLGGEGSLEVFEP